VMTAIFPSNLSIIVSPMMSSQVSKTNSLHIQAALASAPI
jgi:hypothetical protein